MERKAPIAKNKKVNLGNFPVLALLAERIKYSSKNTAIAITMSQNVAKCLKNAAKNSSKCRN